MISGKTVKKAKKRIFDTCILKSLNYEFSDFSCRTVVISRKTVQ